MFTGLIEQICQVRSLSKKAGSMDLAVDLGSLIQGTKIGDSIALNGVCLTVTKIAGSVANFDVSAETLEKSTIGLLKVSDTLNAERAMPAKGRFGGHFVQGHIDGTACVKKITKQDGFSTIQFTAGAELLSQMVVKGSVAVNGISLTIASMDAESFTVAVIPETLAKTTLGQAKEAYVVNIETDIIIKAVKKQLENILPAKESLTMDKLRQMGF
jgi:riboflavin synthase